MTLQFDRPLKPTHLTLRIGPLERGEINPIDVRSVRAAQAMMEESGRRQFAQRAKNLPVIWPTAKATWDGLMLTITAEVANG